jgi:hypothetical protein
MPAQEKDPAVKAAVETLTAFYARAGRHLEVGRIEPNGVVLSLQPLRAIQKYPQWRTIPSDLILLGSPKDNLLIMDEARGGLLPGISKPGEGSPVVTYSPFVGEYQVLNLLATDEAGLRRAVTQTTTP